MEFLAESGFILAKSELGFINQQYLQQFDCLVIGNMYESYFEIEEIDNIVKFVKEGGGLLLISDQGGDYDNRNNISELGSQFGIYFNADHIYDPVNFVDKTDFIIVKDFRPHFITQGVGNLVHSSGCSLTISEEQISADTVVDGIAFASSSARHNTYTGIEWVDEPCPGATIVAVARYFKGKVVAIGNLSMLSSLGASYGLKVESNKLLVGNSFAWLLNQTPTSGDTLEHQMLVSVNLEESNYNWAMQQVTQHNWPNISTMLNFTIRTLRSATQQKETPPSKAPAQKIAKVEESQTPLEEKTPAPSTPETSPPQLLVTEIKADIAVKEEIKEIKPPAEPVPTPADVKPTPQYAGEEAKPKPEKVEPESKQEKIPAKVPAAKQKPAKKFVRKPIKKPPPSKHPASKPRRNPLS